MKSPYPRGRSAECKTEAERAERKRQNKRRHYLKHREKFRAEARQWAARNPLRRRFISYGTSARYRGVSFSLHRELFEDLATDSCFYCGNAPKQFNGIDRVNNERGYEFGNVVTCCSTCNVAKGTKTVMEFATWTARIGSRVNGWKEIAS